MSTIPLAVLRVSDTPLTHQLLTHSLFLPERANWPIQQHWVRIIALASAWSGLNPRSTEHANDPAYLAAALKGMDYWFANDYTNLNCTGSGGKAACPCDTPGLWNTNWYSNVLLIPQLVSTACLIVQPSGLTGTQTDKCESIPRRAYDLRDKQVEGIGSLTGANMVQLMQNSASLALFANDTAILSDALTRAFGATLFADTPGDDGIHRDGSFLQHVGIVYNGNYGKDALNGFVQLEGEAIGTSYAANDSVREAFAALVAGDEWMIYKDQATGQLHWDFNVIGRFVAFPTPDLQASADINFNATLLGAATADFGGSLAIAETVARLKSNFTSAALTGNKAFYASDYMVHRRDAFVLGNKMLSSRGHNTEYTNSANPLGYFMGQGTLFTYVTGNEYRDIQAEWDWNLIPGTTVLLDHPKLNSSIVNFVGLHNYVGVVSDGKFGVSAMEYTDPYDKSLSFRKAWFYLDNSVLVTTTAVSVATGVDATPVTVLDQRASVPDSQILVDGKPVQPGAHSAHTLHYGGNGYYSHSTPFNLTLANGPQSGNWSAISTSTLGEQTANIFSAYTTTPPGTYSYELFPSCGKDTDVANQARRAGTTPIDGGGGTLGAAGKGRLALAFFPNSTSSVSTPLRDIGFGSGKGSNRGAFTVAVDQPVLVMVAGNGNVCRSKGSHGGGALTVTVADPTQVLSSVTVALSADGMELECGTGVGNCAATNGGVSVTVALPSGGMAGSSVQFTVSTK